MYTPIQLEAIKLFGKKDLKEGCLYITDTYTCTVRFDDVVRENNRLYSERYDDSYVIDEILGHIPHLEDLFRVAEETGKNLRIIDDEKQEGSVIQMYAGNFFRYDLKIPLLDQSSLPEIISLFK